MSTSALFAAEPIDLLIQEYMKNLEHLAQQSNPSFSEFSAETGKRFYFEEHSHPEAPNQRNCASCHSSNPANPGKTQVGKPIDPLQPSVNVKRFKDVREIEKWFGRNCKWVLQRECTAQEKGDFIYYLHSL
ncbi:MAG: DUF1924 domain-containing protein [SAR324 cluster bacterium]|nr:DUF1924 domain-containing protein [SAR324 cluster bacterium]